jgi:HlyD family secretion protein
MFFLAEGKVMMEKILIIFVIPTAVGVRAYCMLKKGNHEIAFRTERMDRGDIATTVTATEMLNAVTIMLWGLHISGTRRKLYADFKSRVKKGHLIAGIDPSLSDAQAARAKGNLLLVKVNVEKAVEILVDVKRTIQGNEGLFAKNFIARSDLDRDETNYGTDVVEAFASKAAMIKAVAVLKYG